MTLDNYTAVYGADETSEVSVDLIVGILGALVGFGSLIALVLLFKFLKKKIGKR